MTFGMEKLEWCALPDIETNLKIRLFVLTESTNVTDGRTDGRTPHDDIGRACIASSGKNCDFRPTSGSGIECRQQFRPWSKFIAPNVEVVGDSNAS